MSSLMCFRASKKTKKNASNRDSSYGTIDRNVAPNSRMTGGPKDVGLTIHYITSKLIVLSCGDATTEEEYRKSLQTSFLVLKTKHDKHFKVWSVSQARHDVSALCSPHYEHLGWPACLSPPLDRLCVICKQIEHWLAASTDNVAIIHCKGDPARAAMIISSFMHYNAICSNDDVIEDRFSMQRFCDKYIGGTGQPSHRRYIHYFSSLLSGRIRVNTAPLYLLGISLSNFQGVTVFLKVYERMQCVMQTIPITLKENSKIDIDEELKLRGDVLIKCIGTDDPTRAIFLCQLNTCSVDISDRSKTLTFHKEDLDFIFADPSIDNKLLLELFVSFDPPKSAAGSKRTFLLENRTKSYENFQICEDEPAVPASSVVYSEIKKEPKQPKQEDENTDTDESEQKSDKMAPPPVPPKPRSASAMDQPIEDMPERRGVLPAQVRPVVAHRPPSPRAAGRATPSIEPDLVGKDRYDKASKCFSYAPAKALNEAFERPRRPSMSRTIERKEEEMNHVDPRDAANVEISPQDLHRFEEPETWGDQVENTKQEALLKELSRMPARSHSVAAQPYYNRNDEEIEEKPVVMEQAQRAVAVTTPTGTLQRNKTKYGSYRTLNDERYNSVMDDLCNPEFYLNYQTPNKKEQNSVQEHHNPRKENNHAPIPPPRQSHMGAKSVEMPRRRFQPIEAFTDPLDEILNSTGPAPAASCVDLRERDSFRNRNCRSVAAAPSSHKKPSYIEKRDSPYFRDRRLFSENYDAIESAKEPDDWLMNKLRKVKSKRDLDPDLVRRRTQEKMLLEELKHAHGDNETSRTKDESAYTTEGVGNRAFDALADYKREEERLRNTHSPYQDGQRRGRPIRSKPPTPPPRERSRSPTNKSERATPSIDSHYNTYHYQNGHSGGAKEQENYDFSTLNSIVQPTMNGRESRSLQRKPSFGPPFQYSENTLNNRPDTPTRFFSGQERVAAAITRAETPQRELYASGTIYRAETPNRYYPENNTLAQRSATPSFPVARETPIPFHPLLYNQGKTDADRAQTLNYRSSSPRSQYGQLSRRSSMNSVDTSEIIHHHPIFVKDTSKYWYKPTISREQAITMLRDKAPGTFVVRDSNSFPGAFGLALKVSAPPPGVAPGDGTELVRHFLIEPSPKGVKLKGCNNEPVFGSLSALVYQHSITPLALPTRLLLPEYDPASTPEHVSATQALLEQGAACNVSFVGSIDVESLTGSECVRRAIGRVAEDSMRGQTRPVSVHFKVSSQGVTLTDNTRKVFFRRHFPVTTVIYAGMDPSDRRFDNYAVIGYHDGCVSNARMFAFVARKPSSSENSCHVFAELEPEQPASAVVNFINKVMLAQRK